METYLVPHLSRLFGSQLLVRDKCTRPFSVGCRILLSKGQTKQNERKYASAHTHVFISILVSLG